MKPNGMKKHADSKIRSLIDRLGGPSFVAASLGIAYTTVATWRIKGRIPAHRQAAVIALGKRLGRRVTARDVVAP